MVCTENSPLHNANSKVPKDSHRMQSAFCISVTNCEGTCFAISRPETFVFSDFIIYSYIDVLPRTVVETEDCRPDKRATDLRLCSCIRSHCFPGSLPSITAADASGQLAAGDNNWCHKSSSLSSSQAATTQQRINKLTAPLPLGESAQVRWRTAMR